MAFAHGIGCPFTDEAHGSLQLFWNCIWFIVALDFYHVLACRLYRFHPTINNFFWSYFNISDIAQFILARQKEGKNAKIRLLHGTGLRAGDEYCAFCALSFMNSYLITGSCFLPGSLYADFTVLLVLQATSRCCTWDWWETLFASSTSPC